MTDVGFVERMQRIQLDMAQNIGGIRIELPSNMMEEIRREAETYHRKLGYA